MLAKSLLSTLETDHRHVRGGAINLRTTYGISRECDGRVKALVAEGTAAKLARNALTADRDRGIKRFLVPKTHDCPIDSPPALASMIPERKWPSGGQRLSHPSRHGDY